MASLPVPLTLTKIAPVAFKIGPEATRRDGRQVAGPHRAEDRAANLAGQ